jgi:ribosomal protein L33
MAKGAREKIKLESTAGTGHFVHDHQKQEDHARQNADHEI